MRKHFWLILVLVAHNLYAKDVLVKNTQQLNIAIGKAQPGDNIILANGLWKNIEILFETYGSERLPITLKAQTKGKVIITGESNLRIAGKHLNVQGLVFKNGHSQTAEIVAFRKDSKKLAVNCRLTECVIDNFNGNERNDVEAWVVLFGRYNRVDHCQFIDKRNQGVTLVVRLDTDESAENRHKIDHNYFGFRQNLGGNGGETLRIGTSHNSMKNSQTLVEYNYFDRCNGEHEIISNKSNQNTYKYNTFFECKGTLTMRHGNETWVEGNVFLGNDIPFTGGIRVINEKQTVVNNYLEGITGARFRGALTIMSGVPNSPLNRYVPVIESNVSNNTLIDCYSFELGAGNDAERSQAPKNTSVKNNLFYTSNKPQNFGVYSDLSGITFENNLLNKNANLPAEEGFRVENIELAKQTNGLRYAKGIGASIKEKLSSKDNTGVNWYSKEAEPKRQIKIIVANPGLNTLYDAVKKAKSGDIIELKDGEYNLTKIISLNAPITIKGSSKTVLTYETNNLFVIENEGGLKLENLTIDGLRSNDSPLNAVISTSKYSMNKNYSLFVDNCKVKNLNVNNLYNFLKVSTGTFADTISLRNSSFSTISGDIIALNKENDDIGLYNAETVILENCDFTDIEGAALVFYRGGSDESTTAGFVSVNHCDFNNVGLGKRNASKAAFRMVGLQNLDIRNSWFEKTAAINMKLIVGEPSARIHHNMFKQSATIEVKGDGYIETNNIFNVEEVQRGDDNFNIGKIKK